MYNVSLFILDNHKFFLRTSYDYWRIFYRSHNNYNYLQSLLKHKVPTKVIKMPSCKAWVQSPSSGLIKRQGVKRKCLKWDCRN
jgi:hypothetical protein